MFFIRLRNGNIQKTTMRQPRGTTPLRVSVAGAVSANDCEGVSKLHGGGLQQLRCPQMRLKNDNSPVDAIVQRMAHTRL